MTKTEAAKTTFEISTHRLLELPLSGPEGVVFRARVQPAAAADPASLAEVARAGRGGGGCGRRRCCLRRGLLRGLRGGRRAQRGRGRRGQRRGGQQWLLERRTEGKLKIFGHSSREADSISVRKFVHSFLWISDSIFSFQVFCSEDSLRMFVHKLFKSHERIP